jgi:hypothetical protein
VIVLVGGVAVVHEVSVTVVEHLFVGDDVEREDVVPLGRA